MSKRSKKRARTEVKEAPRVADPEVERSKGVRAQEGPSDATGMVALMTVEFEDFIYQLRDKFVESQRSLGSELRSLGLSRELVKGPTLISPNELPEELRDDAREMIRRRDRLVGEMFEFMKEAAAIVQGAAVELEFDVAELVNLSGDNLTKLCEKTLQQYMDSTVQRYLVVTEDTSGGDKELERYVAMGKRICRDPAAIEFIDGIWNGFKWGCRRKFSTRCVFPREQARRSSHSVCRRNATLSI